MVSLEGTLSTAARHRDALQQQYAAFATAKEGGGGVKERASASQHCCEVGSSPDEPLASRGYGASTW